jgi:hypothetical protein
VKNRKMSMIHKIGCIIILLALMLISVPANTISADTPGETYYFWGSLSLDGVLAPVGTVVTAKVNGVEVSESITTDIVGIYATYGSPLLVQSLNGVSVGVGSEVHFYANGYECEQTQIIQSDVININHFYPLDLTADTNRISGSVYEVRGMALPQGPDYPISGATVKLIKGGVVKGTATSDAQGNYTITVPETGDYTLNASKFGFRDENQLKTISTLGQEYTCDFKSKYGLIPNAPTIWYVLACAALWKYQPQNTELALDMWTLLDVASAWKYPI